MPAVRVTGYLLQYFRFCQVGGMNVILLEKAIEAVKGENVIVGLKVITDSAGDLLAETPLALELGLIHKRHNGQRFNFLGADKRARLHENSK